MAASRHLVVLPNMLATTTGFWSPAATSASTMPQMAPAARAKMIREIRLRPCTSTTAGIIAMSLVPT